MPSSTSPRCDMTSHIRRTSAGLALASLPNSRIPAIPHIQVLHPSARLRTHNRNLQNTIESLNIAFPFVVECGVGRCLERSYVIRPLKLLNLVWLRDQRFVAPLSEAAPHH